MLVIKFRERKHPQPFAIGSQCHFGLGLFVAYNGQAVHQDGDPMAGAATN